MTPSEYIQLKAFARQDGALLALLWVASFAAYIAGLSSPTYSMFALILLVLSPFLVARRLRNYRDKGLEGVISFGRSWGFVVLTFFYASLLFAIVQYAYFAYIDNGYMMEAFDKMMKSPEAEQLAVQYGMRDTLEESMEQLGQMRPIDLSLNVLTTNIMLGMLFGLPIAAVMKRSAASSGRE